MDAKVLVLLTLLLASLHSEVGGGYKVLFELYTCACIYSTNLLARCDVG